LTYAIFAPAGNGTGATGGGAGGAAFGACADDNDATSVNDTNSRQLLIRFSFSVFRYVRLLSSKF
jgi:hypothetical protein